MEVAIVGGGLFGVTAAIEISDRVLNADVTLYERENDILQAASGINQWRLHRGYHYPRSKPTAISCRDSHDEFKARFGEAVITEHDHYYCIAAEGSRTTPEAFLEHCTDIGLQTERSELDIIKDDSISLCVEVEENHIDPLTLKSVLWQQLDEYQIDVNLNEHVESASRLSEEFDYVVVAAYAGTNALLSDYPKLKREYKFQLIEKPVVTLPEPFHDRSVVVMDGPFMSFDPYGRTTRVHLDHVQYGVRDEHVGFHPQFEDFNPSLLNGAIKQSPPNTDFPLFIDSYRKFFHDVGQADYLGSYFTIRTVLPDRNETDARPTIVNRTENVFQVFSGKMCTCVEAADRLVDGILSS